MTASVSALTQNIHRVFHRSRSTVASARRGWSFIRIAEPSSSGLIPQLRFLRAFAMLQSELPPRHAKLNIPYNDSSIVYYPLIDDQCKDPCRNTWMRVKNESAYVTTGPDHSTGLAMLFKGSTTITIFGGCPWSKDKHGLDIRLNNDSSLLSFWTTTQSSGPFAGASNLRPHETYNLTINYGGEGELRIVGFGLDPNSKVIPMQPPHFSTSSATNGNTETLRPTTPAPGSSSVSQSLHARPSSDEGSSSGQGPAELDGPSPPISHAALGGLIAGAAASLCIVVVAAWFIRRRILARRAPSYAFRKASNAGAHWTQRPQSPAVPRSADWESFTLPAKEETVHSPLLERHSSVTESKMGIAL